MSAAREAGRRASLRGKPASDNPFRVGNRKRSEWFDGWSYRPHYVSGSMHNGKPFLVDRLPETLS